MSAPIFCTPIDDFGSALTAPHVVGDNALVLSNAAPLGSPSATAPVRLTVLDSTLSIVLGQFLAVGAIGNTVSIQPDAGFADVALPVGSIAQVNITAAELNSIHAAILANTTAIATISLTPGPTGSPGQPGSAATISLGTVTTGAPGSAASVTNSGNSSAATFNFVIPAGEPGTAGTAGVAGAPGAAATIAIGSVTTGAPGTSASVTNVGTAAAATFNFAIPAGATGQQGTQGVQGVPGPSGVVTATAPLSYNASTQTVSLAATGTASSATFLRGDGTWASPPAAPVSSVAGRTGAIVLTTADVGGLATVATSGKYTDLTSLPTLGTLAGLNSVALTGDVTGSGAGSFSTTLATTGVTAGSYSLASLTVDAKGRITAASSGTVPAAGSSGQIQYNNGGVFAGASGFTVSGSGQLTLSSQSGTTTVRNDQQGSGLILAGASAQGDGVLRIIGNANGWMDRVTTAYFQIDCASTHNATLLSGGYGSDHAFNRFQICGLHTSISSVQYNAQGYPYTPVPVATFEVANGLDQPAVRWIANSTQTTDMVSMVNAAGTTMGLIDCNGCHRMALTSGKPTTTPSVAGAVMFDPAALKLWVYSGSTSGWVGTVLS